MILPMSQQETLDLIRQGKPPRDFRATRVLLRYGLIEVANKYVAASEGANEGQNSERCWVVTYRETKAALLLLREQENQAVTIGAPPPSLCDSKAAMQEPLDPNIEEVIDAINFLFDDMGCKNVHITDILVTTSKMSIKQTQEVISAMEKADILRFDGNANVCYLEEFPNSAQVRTVRSILALRQETTAFVAQDKEELFVVLDLSVNDELSQRFVEELFPYEPGDAAILCDVRDALAILRLQRIMMTKKQQQALRETTAVVGYTLKVREELTSFLSEFYGS